jgi:hypothetical protein
MCQCLDATPIFYSKEAHPFGSGIRHRILVAKIEIIPQPLLILGIPGNIDATFVEKINMPYKNNIRDQKRTYLL